MKHLIVQWYDDNKEHINDQINDCIQGYLDVQLEHDDVFFDVIKNECIDELREDIVNNCSKSLALSYEECKTTLEDIIKWK